MNYFAANLTMMYPEFDLPDRFTEESRDGFTAVELLQPYGESIDDLGAWLDNSRLQMILLNTPMGDVANGERGLAGLPGSEADFNEAFAQSLTYAVELNIPMIHVMAGVVPDGVSKDECGQVLVSNLQRTADQAAEHGICLNLEPLNQVDLPGYLYTSAAEAKGLIDQIDRENVKLQYDFYHLQFSAGDLGGGLRKYFGDIGHVQFSSVPGRHEPQYGEVNLPFLFDLLDELNYDGWVGCEYRPKTTTRDGLFWGKPFGLGGE